MLILGTTLGLLLFASVLPAQTSTAPHYTITDLGTLGGWSRALGLNNSGQVVGEASTGDGWYHAVLFSGTGSCNTDLGTLGGYASTARAINDHGVIVGDAIAANGYSYATRFNPTGENTPIAGAGSVANDINNAGVATGNSTDVWGRTVAGLSGDASSLFGLGFVPNSANSINNNGQIVGDARNSNFNNLSSAVEYRGSDLAIRLGDADEASVAMDNNDLGQVVGSAYGGNEYSVSYRYPTLFSAGTNINLDPTGRGFQNATGINNKGQVVGDGFLWEDGNLYAFTEIVGEAPSDWGGFEWLGYYGAKINDWGQIAATVGLHGVGDRAVLLNPATPNTIATPEGAATKFVGGMDYALLPGATGSATTAGLLAGTAGSGSEGEFGANRNVTLSFSAPDPSLRLVSDIVSLTGTEDDVFVLSLSYDPEQHADGSVSLLWLDESDDLWKLAVEGNQGTPGTLAGNYTVTFEDFLNEYGLFNASTMLGAYGSAEGSAWAVLNHNSFYGVGDISSVPEPGSTIILVGLLASGIVFRRRE